MDEPPQEPRLPSPSHPLVAKRRSGTGAGVPGPGGARRHAVASAFWAAALLALTLVPPRAPAARPDPGPAHPVETVEGPDGAVVGFWTQGGTPLAGRLARHSLWPGGQCGPLPSNLLAQGGPIGLLGVWSGPGSHSVDPADDCTLSYTGGFVPAGGPWATRGGAFQVEGCDAVEPTFGDGFESGDAGARSATVP